MISGLLLLPAAASAALTEAGAAGWRQHAKDNLFQGLTKEKKTPINLPSTSRRMQETPAYQYDSWWQGDEPQLDAQLAAAEPLRHTVRLARDPVPAALERALGLAGDEDHAGLAENGGGRVLGRLLLLKELRRERQ